MRSYFSQAWEKAIEAYKCSHINSERTLQAILYSHLKSYLPRSLIVICEPTIELEKNGKIIPDMLVIDGEEVIAVVELKFVPHHYPRFEGDLEKLLICAETQDRFDLLLSPDNGKFQDTRFTFSRNCLLVFGVFGQHDSDALDPDLLNTRMAEIDGRFIHLRHPVGGIYESKDNEAFLPLKSEELDSGLGRRYIQLNDLAKNSRNKAIEQNIAQRVPGRKDSAGWYPLVISGAPAYLCFQPNLWSQYAETPLWLRIDSVDGNRPTQEIENRISHARFMNGVKAIYSVSDGRFWIPLFPAIGKEQVAVLDDLVDQIRVIGNIVAAEVVNIS